MKIKKRSGFFLKNINFIEKHKKSIRTIRIFTKHNWKLNFLFTLDLISFYALDIFWE